MARYKKEHRDEARAAILDATSKRLRKSGFHGVGVDGLMAEAGLTSGAFYSHFPSKEALLAEVVGLSGSKSLDRIGRMREEHGDRWLFGYIEYYLGTTHRDALEVGCSLPALAVDVGRSGDAVRESFEQSLTRLTGELAKGVKGNDDEERLANARSLISLLVGALVLSRALPPGGLSDGYLNDVKRLALQLVAPVGILA